MLNLNFIPFPTLVTPRLVLRQVSMQDENEMYALRKDERVNRFLDRPVPESIEDVRKHIDKLNEGIHNNESIYWIITLKPDHKLVGAICFWNISRENAIAEIGFELHPGFQGKGIMQESLEKVIEFGFSVMKLRKIEGWTKPENSLSIRIMKKNKFKRDIETENMKRNNEEPLDHVIYSLDYEEYCNTDF